MTTSQAARERGSLTLFAGVFFLALLAGVGLVVDGGAKLRAAREASATAEEAARAGAGQVDRDRAYAHGGRFTVDPAAAARAARAYLAASGHTGTVTVTGSRNIRVTVTVRKPTTILGLLGMDTMTARMTATATLVQGVERGVR